MELGLRHNPSMKPFIPAMIKLSWAGARFSAARTMNQCLYVHPEQRNEVLDKQREKGNWKNRLPKDCPWQPIEIVGYDPDDENDHLLDPRYLPFRDPFFPDRTQRSKNA